MATTQDDRIADLQRAIAELRQERDAALAQKVALAEVLDVINRFPGDPGPVFEAILEKAHAFCGATLGSMTTYDGAHFHVVATHGYPDQLVTLMRQPRRTGPEQQSALRGERYFYAPDVKTIDVGLMDEVARTNLDLTNLRTYLSVPLRKDGNLLGIISAGRQEVRPFAESEITLLEGFAAQGAIAMENARLLGELQRRTTDLQESLEYQTATGDVLKVISRSTFDLQPVLDTVAQTAARLCDADQAAIYRREGESARLVANFGFPPEYETYTRALGAFAIDPTAVAVGQRTLVEGRPVHVHDVAAVPGYWEIAITLGKQRTSLGVPLLREGETIGNIMLARQRVEPFTDRQIELVSTFADQAVIAIENTRLINEQQEALEQQTATAEVLQVINASPGNLTPVFDAMLERALHLCESAFGVLATYDGEAFHHVAFRGVTPDLAEFLRQPFRPAPGLALHGVLQGEEVVQVADIVNDDAYRSGIPGRRAMADLGGARTQLLVALRKDEVLLGVLLIFRQEVRPFTEKQIALLRNFAAQAVIAIENTRLITEQREALEQQTATAEVLQVINTSPGNLTPVFEAILEKAHSLCGAVTGSLSIYNGEYLRAAVAHGYPESHAALLRQPYPLAPHHHALIRGERFIHIPDIRTAELLREHSITRNAVKNTDLRTCLMVPLRKDDVVLGFITGFRPEVRLFSDKEIALLENFAAQAVIAMENARLLGELRTRTDELAQRQAELRVTFENMGDGVAMFDETQHLVAWNRKFQDILDVPDDIIARQQTFSEYVRYLADRGEYGVGPGVEEQVRHLTERAGQYRTYERTRPDGRVIEIRHNPVPSGGFVLIFSDITERKRNEAEIRAARDAAESAYRELKAAQANLIQAEKMASLGQLTAGIAHEIKNPLNFVNNFAALSVDLLSELKETAAPGLAALTDGQRADIDDVSAMLTSNLEKITEHGKRADGIVKAMLEHSRGSSTERRMVDLNAVIDEALNLGYHGARAQDQSFNITLVRDFDKFIAPIEVNPQDMTRVFLNVFSNGFYAANRRARNGGNAGFVPVLKVTTREAGEALEIRVRDNGTGIPADIRDKLFQPFFTTKPTGEGTGLGLSITYDIVTKQHGGTITVDSEVDAFTEFVITLPRRMFAKGGDRA